MAHGLKELLDYDGDVEDDFCLSYQVSIFLCSIPGVLVDILIPLNTCIPSLRKISEVHYISKTRPAANSTKKKIKYIL